MSYLRIDCSHITGADTDRTKSRGVCVCACVCVLLFPESLSDDSEMAELPHTTDVITFSTSSSLVHFNYVSKSLHYFFPNLP